MGRDQTNRDRGRLARRAVVLMTVALVLLSCAPAPTSRQAGQAAGGGSTAPAAPKTLRIAMQSQNEPPGSTAGPVSPAQYGGSGAGSAALEHYFIFHGNLTAFDSQRNVVARIA